MEDLFDTFNRLTQLRARESEPSSHRSKTLSAAARYANSKPKALETYSFDSESNSHSSKWFDLDHAVATGIEPRMGSSFKSSETDELDFMPGPLEYSDEEFSEDLSEKNKNPKESVILEELED